MLDDPLANMTPDELRTRIGKLQAELEEKTKLLDQVYSGKTDEGAQMLDYTFAAIIGIDTGLVIQSWNRAAVKLYGWTADEVIGKPVDVVLKTEFQIPEEDVIHQIQQSGVWEGEMSQYCKDGTQVNIQGSIILLRDEQGNPQSIIITNLDITDRKQAEKALYESETQYRTLFDNMAQGVFYQNADSTLINVNDAALELFGLTRDQFLQRTSYDREWKVMYEDGTLVPADQHPSMIALRTGKPVRNLITGVFNYQKNEYVWMSVNAIPEFRPGEDRPYQVVVTLHDITRSKKAEESLRLIRDELTIITDSIPIRIAHYSSESRYIYANEAYARFLNRTKEELIGLHSREVVGEEIYQHVQPYHQRVLKGEIVTTEDIRHEEDGVDRTYLMIYIPHKAENGEIIGFFTFVQDITQRVQTEQALRENQARLDLALRSAQMGTWSWDILQQKRYFDDQVYLLMGIDLATFSGEINNFFAKVPADDQDLIRKTLAQAIESDVVFDVEFRVNRQDDDSTHYLSTRGKVVHDESGKPMRVNGILWDITGNKNMEAALVEAEKLAGIGTLAAGMAHEINNPLQVITGTSDSLLRRLNRDQEIELEELNRKLSTISSNGWRIAAIVRSLLDYARSSAEEVNAHSLNEIVQKTLLITEHQFKSWSNIYIVTELAGDLPLVVCDSNKITQVLVNLLTNARDAMPLGGQITISTAFDRMSKMVTLRVIDNGDGIPDEIRSKIFDPFFTTKPFGTGTGLGLSIAKGILRAHGGDLELESSNKQGTIFKVSLPLSSEANRDNNES